MATIQLKGITWDHPRGYAPLEAASALYQKKFGISVAWEKRSLKKFGDESLTSLARNYDLLIIDHPHSGVAANSECLLPLEEYLPEEKFRELRMQSAGPSFDSYFYGDSQWALPIDAAMQCAAAREDLLGDQSLPASWEEVFSLVNTLKNKDLKIGVALCSTDSLCTFLSLTAQLGSPIREGSKELVDKKTTLEVLAMMRKMRDIFHEDCLLWNPIQLYDHMSEYDDIAYSPLAFCYSNYSRAGFRKKRLSFGNAPGIHQAVLGGAGIAVSARCRQPSVAVHYASWVCSAEIQTSLYVEAQGQPGNGLAWIDEKANRITNNFFRNTRDTLVNAFVRPRFKEWPAFQEFLGDTVHNHLINDTEPEAVLKTLQDTYRELPVRRY